MAMQSWRERDFASFWAPAGADRSRLQTMVRKTHFGDMADLRWF
jgi:hypothetical protein